MINTTDKRTQQRKTGDAGEELAVSVLKKEGYEIEARNFACKCGEIDIIARNNREELIAFVEVKSRNRTDFGLPCEAVNSAKQHRLRRTAEYYLMTHRGLSEFQPSMDIIEILRINGDVYFRHIKNAF